MIFLIKEEAIYPLLFYALGEVAPFLKIFFIISLKYECLRLP